MRFPWRYLLVIAALMAGALLLPGCGGSNTQFCEIAATSVEERTEAEINEFYKQLEAAAPSEIKGDVAVLRGGWKDLEFTFGGGEATRPREVSDAARNVFQFVGEVCGTEGGVYLIYPDMGF